uniref:uncharacterized protein LOC105350407 n=1 Tax=Fragaria vesca subsp. vesca TaxID=101020 RepID=UPI0005CA0C20|nr:PREDICTED: uncharacterized protein LOC105350407 [Fragaria vesca subsp. vesca]
MSPPNKLGELTITLANPDHSVFGGLVLSATPLRAACPIQLILGAFNQEEQLNHMNVIRRASTAYPSVIASPNLPTISTQVMSNHAGAQYGIRVPCPQTFPNVIASPNLPIIPTQLIIPTQVMPNHEGDQYEIRVPCPQIFPAFNNNQDETPVRYQQTSFFNLNHLP